MQGHHMMWTPFSERAWHKDWRKYLLCFQSDQLEREFLEFHAGRLQSLEHRLLHPFENRGESMVSPRKLTYSAAMPLVLQGVLKSGVVSLHDLGTQFRKWVCHKITALCPTFGIPDVGARWPVDVLFSCLLTALAAFQLASTASVLGSVASAAPWILHVLCTAMPAVLALYSPHW